MVYKMSAISKRGQLLFNVNGKTEVSASDSTLKSGRVGLDAFDSEASFTNVRIEGKVDRKWAEEFLRKKYAEEQKAGDPEEAKK